MSAKQLVRGDPLLVLPSNADMEAASLAAVLIDTHQWEPVRRRLTSHDFTNPLWRRAFVHMERLHQRGVPIDVLTLKDSMLKAGDLEHDADRVRLTQLVGLVHKGAPADFYAEIVADCGRRRRAMEIGERIQQIASDGGDPEALRQQHEALAEALTPRGFELPSETLTAILSRPAPPTPWAVEGLLCEGDICIVSGAGGIGKSWISLVWALTMATGTALFDRFPSRRAFRVAIADLETRGWEIDQRLQRIAAGLDAPLKGELRVIRRRIRLDVPGDVERLIVSVEAWGTDFLIVDSLRRAFVGDENKSEVIGGLFLGALDRIRSETGCGIILVDHTRKATGDRDLDAAAVALRGSSDKRNMADCHLGVEQRQERLAIVPTKIRHGRAPEAFLLDVRGLEEEPSEGEPRPVSIVYVGALDVASDRVQDALLALLAEGPKLRGELIGRAGYSERSVNDGLAALKSRGRISAAKEGRQTRYTLTTATAAHDGNAPEGA